MPASTAELQNWRARPEYNARLDQGTLNLWDFLRAHSWGTMGTINKMPNVFDPTNYSETRPDGEATSDQIRNVIKPNSPQPGSMGLISLLQQAQDPNNPLYGLLGALAKSATAGQTPVQTAAPVQAPAAVAAPVGGR